mgnify:CR=1 FL=1
MHAPQVNIALRAARQAGNLIRRAAENNDPLSVDRKAANDFVTQVDRAASTAFSPRKAASSRAPAPAPITCG